VRYEREVPYRASDKTNKCPTGTYWTSGFTKHTVVGKGELATARALMVNPTVVTIGAGFTGFKSYTSGVWSCGNNVPMDHAVLLTGYTNGVKMQNGQTWNIWYVKNSWGTNWGQGGYFSVRKDCPGIGALGIYQNGGMLPMRQG
jgi:Papain family cysteine protease